jgi:putative ABC transport system ATP-binding protein
MVALAETAERGGAAAPVIEFRAVAKSFRAEAGPVPVLRDVDLCVREGDFAAITGPSGSGKSTLLHLAALLDQPTAGSVLFEGRDVSRLGQGELCGLRKSRVGMVFQSFRLLGHRSARDNVLFRFRYTDHPQAWCAARAEEAMKTLGVADIADRTARLLSGGEMQRVAIARAIALRPGLLVADEPTGNLDRASARAVMECFRLLNRGGLTILMVTHNESLLEYCSRHLVCRDGGLVEGSR